MTVFAFWFDTNKELNYPFLGTRVIRGSRFCNDFTIRVNYAERKHFIEVNLEENSNICKFLQHMNRYADKSPDARKLSGGSKI